MKKSTHKKNVGLKEIAEEIDQELAKEGYHGKDILGKLLKKNPATVKEK